MDFILSLVTLTALALVVGAFFLWRRQGVTKQVGLMLLLVGEISTSLFAGRRRPSG